MKVKEAKLMSESKIDVVRNIIRHLLLVVNPEVNSDNK